MRVVRVMMAAMLFLAACSIPRAVAQASDIHGSVSDSSGAPVPGAQVTFHGNGVVRSAKTDSAGQFTLPGLTSTSGTVEVKAAGFAAVKVPWTSATTKAGDFIISLKPAAAQERIVVSATRLPVQLSDAPGGAILFSETDLAANPALTADDVLRQVPGFSLFRRTGSRTANPTSQGVSLRGLGASGASRALVLDEGVPLLDPFGGWVYWDRVPRAALSNAEVFRGAASNLYGSDAMGGVVQFSRRQPLGPALVLESSFGNQRTPYFSGWTGTKLGAWTLQAATDLFYSGGYILVPAPFRGAVDTPANSEHGTLDFEVSRRIGRQGRLFARSNLFEESRHNGTALQINDTQIVEPVIGIDQQFGASDSLSARIYGDAQNYHQTFSSIVPDRSRESLTDLQHVPAQEIGADGQWTHAVGHSQTLLAGLNLLETMGTSEEQLFFQGTHTANSLAGGRQRTWGVFAEDILRLGSQWTVIPSVRFDRWSNFDGRLLRTPFSGAPPTSTFYSDRSYNAFSPRLSLIRALGQNLSATASIYRAFRAPTLNELYRSFRVGGVVTQNNAALQAERLTGAEAGLSHYAWNRRVELRGTFFWSDIVNPIANVTLSRTPTLITRQRQNLGRTRSRGVEADTIARVTDTIQISAGYAYTDATVVSFPADITLQGLELPQVPRNQFTWGARYWNPSRLMLSLQGRAVGRQFDDDQNQLPLGSFTTVDLMIGRSLLRGVEAFFAAENIFDQRYAVARTPVTTLGPPVLYRVGLRFQYPREQK